MRMPAEPVQPADKIAVVRANGVGDFVFAMPALQALRKAYPRAEIVLLGKPWHAAFLSGRPGPIDRVIAIPPCPGVGEPPDSRADPEVIEPFFQAMKEERFDLAIQMHGGGRYSNPFVRRLDARMTVGLRTSDAIPLDRWVPYIYFHYEYLRYLEVVALAGAEPAEIEPRITVTASDLEEASRVLPPSGRPLAVLHPGATDSRRHWPAEKLARVGDTLAQAGAEIAVIGTEPERGQVEAVLRAMRSDAAELCARLSLGGLAGLLARAAVVVGNDSGPLHLAAAVGAATVGIYWCGNFINGAPITRARHRPVMSWRLDCPVCGRNTLEEQCAHRESFVADIPVEEVTASALDLLAREAPRLTRA